MNPHYTYLLVDFLTLLVPFLCSFEHRVAFYRKWKYLLPAIVATGTFFIIWDVFFTKWEVWAFNPQYVSGFYIFGLPIEEWLFFVVVPYSCLFIYECFYYLFRRDYLANIARPLSLGLAVLLIFMAALNTDRLYTSVTFSFTAVFLLLHLFVWKTNYLGRYWLAYLVSLLPFFIVNGLLTALPVVTYNDSENLGIRLGTIPIEDSMYSFLLLLMNTTVFETLRRLDGGQPPLR